MDVNIGKNIVLAVDVIALPAAALDHIIYIGLRNVLMDSHASITRETNPADFEAAARAMAEKKLAALMSGEVRAVGTRSRESDPVRAEAMRIAMDRAKARAKAAGKKLDPKALRAEAIRLVGENPAFMSLAQKHIDEARAIGEELGGEIGD